MKKRGNPFYNRKIKIINRLVEPKYDVGRELKVVGMLEKKYPLAFLETVDLHFQVKSLFWFLGGGKNKLEEFYKVYLLRKTKKESPLILLQEDKIGEDKEIKKQKTIKEFLNKNEEKN